MYFLNVRIENFGASDLHFLKLYCYFINFLFLYIYEYVRWKS